MRQKDKPPKTSPDTEPHPPRVAGLLLAGGAPAPVVAERVAALEAGGCAPVLVVLDPGRRADLPASALALVLEHGPSRLSTRLQAGLRAATTLEPGVDAVLVALPDLPPLGAAGIRRVRDEVHGRGVRALARAGYDGAPGHPVLLGREHWSAAAAAASGDRGAGPYLRRAGTPLVECADQLGAVAAGAPTLER
ncbi:NTP transferase domain-containing protein [Quadrisphaera sp. DSM 44207]|uniref:nucleotidyltransferase family protein n=1 Tax=Quadrisphaera sp. DSM 44207 TaxID=1881057 RepID=UPI00350FB4D9